MNSLTRKLLTIITESALESVLIKDLERLGVRGYTIIDARGKGSRGIRNASWSESGNIHIEVVCDVHTAETVAVHLQANYYDNYAMIVYLSDVAVLRSEKF